MAGKSKDTKFDSDLEHDLKANKKFRDKLLNSLMDSLKKDKETIESFRKRTDIKGLVAWILDHPERTKAVEIWKNQTDGKRNLDKANASECRQNSCSKINEDLMISQTSVKESHNDMISRNEFAEFKTSVAGEVKSLGEEVKTLTATTSSQGKIISKIQEALARKKIKIRRMSDVVYSLQTELRKLQKEKAKIEEDLRLEKEASAEKGKIIISLEEEKRKLTIKMNALEKEEIWYKSKILKLETQVKELEGKLATQSEDMNASDAVDN